MCVCVSEQHLLGGVKHRAVTPLVMEPRLVFVWLHGNSLQLVTPQSDRFRCLEAHKWNL